MFRKLESDFSRHYSFNPRFRGYIGIERERFLVNSSGMLTPMAEEFLSIADDPRWTYELSACQVEDRTAPQESVSAVANELKVNDAIGSETAGKLGLSILNCEVAPADMPLEIYPDPRYLEIRKQISRERLIAACRVAGVHVHIGMSDLKQAVDAYARLRPELDFLCALGDHSNGERLRLYKTMAEWWKPPIIDNAEKFLLIANQQKFLTSPRSCYWLLRISCHGTVELRMFGVPQDQMKILDYVKTIRKILKGIV